MAARQRRAVLNSESGHLHSACASRAHWPGSGPSCCQVYQRCRGARTAAGSIQTLPLGPRPTMLCAGRQVSEDTGGPPRPATMGSKTDLVVWLRLQPLQERVYKVRAGPAADEAAM